MSDTEEELYVMVVFNALVIQKTNHKCRTVTLSNTVECMFV